MELRPLALAALLLLPLLPAAEAGVPVAPAWSPYDAISTVNAVAVSATTAAAALGPPSAPADPAQQSRVAEGDLSILDVDAGFVYNGSGNAGSPVFVDSTQVPPEVRSSKEPGAPLGRSHVAVSKEGHVIASVGRVTDPTGGSAERLRLYYQRIAAGARWPTQSVTNATVTLAGNATDLLLSEDGNLVVLAAQNGPSFFVRGYSLNGQVLSEQFSLERSGTVFDLGGSRDLRHIGVGASIVEGNATYGVLYTIQDRSIARTLYERSTNGTALTSVGATPDGRFIVGDQRGRILVAPSAGSEFSRAVLNFPGPTDPVRLLVVSGDGARAAAGTSNGLVMLNTTRDPALVWNLTYDGGIQTLAMNRTGGTLVVAVNGTSGGVYAYGDEDAKPLWRFLGAARAAAVDDDGSVAAYAQRSAVSVVRIPRAIAFEYPGGLHTGAPRGIQPEGTVAINLVVRNPGAALERVRFEGPRDIDLTLTPQPLVVAVPPSEARNVTFTAVAGRSFTGSHTFNITARSLTSGAVDNVTVTLQLQTPTSVRLVMNGTTEVAVAPGARTDVLIGVVNNGSRDAALGIHAEQAVSQGPAWSIVLDPTTFTLARNTITTVRATVTPPEDALNGTSNAITFVLEGPEVADQTRITFRINPTLGVDITAEGRVKFVEPGKSASYNVTVINTGSLPRTFEAFFQATPTGTKNWGVDMDTNSFKLDPSARRTIPVKIYAPIDAVPGDRVSLFIVARTVPELPNENITQANLTLFANAVPPAPTTTTPTPNPLPGFEAAAAVAALASLSILLRPRRRLP